MEKAQKLTELVKYKENPFIKLVKERTSQNTKRKIKYFTKDKESEMLNIQTGEIIEQGFKKVIIEEQIALGESEESAKRYVESDYAKPHRFLGHI